MRVTMLWHGGTNYAPPGPEGAERFRSLKAVRAVFENRANCDPYYPCEESPEAWLFIGDEVRDYPDRIMRLSPHGAVVVERA